MKKSAIALVFFGLLVAPLASALAGQDKPWFDMENCGVCKNMTAEKGLMENMQWESHEIANGMMSVCMVADGYEEKYTRANENMKAAGESLMKGEKMDLCGFCQSFGSLMMSGAKMENVETKAGHVMLLTSDDPEVVKKIHEHVEKTNTEMAKMMKAHDEHNEHEGHDHN